MKTVYQRNYTIQKRRLLPYLPPVLGKHPDKTTYFQPVLDKLDYAPGVLTFTDRAGFVEGKSDFYILNFVNKKFAMLDLNIIPGTGANDLGPIIALYLGWGKRFVILLDGDKAGVQAKRRYMEEFGLREDGFMTYSDIAGLRCKKVEHLLSDDDLSAIGAYFEASARPSKKQIMRFFQEQMFAADAVGLSPAFVERAELVLRRLHEDPFLSGQGQD